MGDQIVGGFVTLGIGVIVIAAIYQLAKPGGQTITSDATQSYNQTLSSLFK